jgi:uncharacterized lipoprotein YbaY
MKLGLFLTLLMLVASSDVFGQAPPSGRRGRPVQPVGTKEPLENEVTTSTRRPTTIIIDNGESDTVKTTAAPVEVVDEATARPVKTNRLPVARRRPTATTTAVPLEESTTLHTEEHKPLPISEDQRGKTVNIPEEHEIDAEHGEPTEQSKSPQTASTVHQISPLTIGNFTFEHTITLPTITVEIGGRSSTLPSETTTPPATEEIPLEESSTVSATTQSSSSSPDAILISGSITIAKYRPYYVDSVGYESRGGRLNAYNHVTMKPRLPNNYDSIIPGSRVMLYVSTVKTTDRRLAFANFSIPLTNDHFPLSYNVRVELPREQRGLVESADLTLYLYAYVSHLQSRMDTFLPDGTSQILLQGTNHVVQRLQVNVKANGVEVTGFFRGRYSERYIRSGTSFQVTIVPESSLNRLIGESVESVAQLFINSVPDMYPVPFSVLVPHQQLKLGTRYYAIGNVFENGVERPIGHQPIFVINENKALVTPEVTFIVAPHPFILRGTVVRAMPSPFYLEPNSSIIISLHEVDSDSPPIPFRLPVLNQLPQDIQVNITQAPLFDVTKRYEILVTITDSQNRVYMITTKKVPLTDQLARLTLPVEDSFYYVQVRLHSSSNQPLTYIPGSEAALIITENPEIISKPIFHVQFDPTVPDFREYLMKIPITTVRRYSNAYLILLVNNSGILTHVSKTLLISNNQPPALRVELPVISLNLIRGSIYDKEEEPAQWSVSSYVNVFLLNDRINDPEKSIVQLWKVHAEREFPIRFEVQVDFDRLLPGHSYSLQSSIETSPNVFEYRPANKVQVIEPNQPIQDNLRVLVKNVKKTQIIHGLIYISDVEEPLPATSEIILQLSSTPSLNEPTIIHEIRLNVENHHLPLNFTLELPLDQIDINSVYYFLVQYVVGQTVIVPVSQAFAFAPRNEATVVLRLSKSQQVRFTGQVTSTGGRLMLPAGTGLHLYVTDHPTSGQSMIYSEVYLQASTNGLYQFTMYLDSVILQRNITLYFRADIIYKNTILLSIPRPPLLQTTSGAEWNINLVIDLPTLLTGEIILLGDQAVGFGDFEAYIQVIVAGTENVVSTTRVRLESTFPQPFRVEINSELFIKYERLQARALIKNCKEEILFKSADSMTINARLNVDLKLPLILTDADRLKEMTANAATTTPLELGQWQVSLTSVVPGSESGIMATFDSGLIPSN